MWHHVDLYAGTDIFKKLFGSICRVVQEEWLRWTALKMEATNSCKTFVPVYQSIQWHPRRLECLTPCFLNKESSIHDEKLLFFTHNPWDASNLNSQYFVIGISTWLAECNEIKGHNNNADVIYQIVAIKISFQFSRMPTQREANYTFSEKPIHNTWEVTQGGQNPRLLIIYLEFI